MLALKLSGFDPCRIEGSIKDSLGVYGDRDRTTKRVIHLEAASRERR